MSRFFRNYSTTRALRFGALVLLCFGFTSCGKRDPDQMAVSISSPIDSLEAAILKAPNTPEPYHARAQYMASQNNPQGAFEDWGLALKADSAFAPAWENRIDMLYRMQNMEACLEELNACIRYAPESTPCLMRRAEFNIHLNQFERAFGDLNQALRINDQLHEAYWMKGKIYASNGDTEKAISSLQTAIEVNPSFFDGFISLGLFMAELGDPIAEEFYRSAIELRPFSVEAHYNLAMFLQEEQRLDDALAEYREILALDSSNATASFNQGYIHLEYYAQYDSAAFWFTEAIQRLPYYHQAFFNRGLARESLGDRTGAIADYSEALRIKPDYTVAALAKDRALKVH
ncbi:MAG TPA: hypothetical protein DD635_08310 [Flavobacteriales bacterium]|nr:hypothetical protein [Flavobacteriales bacterium]